MLSFFNRLQDALDATRRLDFIGPLLLRLYLVPVFWMAGMHKLADIDATAAWFGNPDWGLGLPFPELLAWAAALTEAGGALGQHPVDRHHAGGDLRRAPALRLAGDCRCQRAVRQ